MHSVAHNVFSNQLLIFLKHSFEPDIIPFYKSYVMHHIHNKEHIVYSFKRPL